MRLAARAVRSRLTASANTVRQQTLARKLIAPTVQSYRQLNTTAYQLGGPIKTTHPAVVDRSHDERWADIEFERYRT